MRVIRQIIKEAMSPASGKVKTDKYSWGTMKTVHHGAHFSIPLHPEHHQAIHKLSDGQSHNFTDETGKKWKATREGDKVHFNGGSGYKTSVAHSDLKEEVQVFEGYAEDDIAKGGTVIYKHQGKHYMSKVSHKTGGGAGTKIHTTSSLGHVVPLHHVVSTDASDWNTYKNRPVKEEVQFNEEKVKHRIGVTVSDPNHPMVSKRKETIQKTVRVAGEDREKAINSAIAHYKRKGYKVHDHHYIGVVKEDVASHYDVTILEAKLKVTHEDPLVTVHDKHGLHTHANLSTANSIFNTKVKHTDVHKGPVKVKDGWETKKDLTFAISKHNLHPALKESDEIDESAWGQDKKANLRAALDRHTEKAVAANKAGDHEAVKVHQSKMNMIKNQMAKLAKEEVEKVDEAGLKDACWKDYEAIGMKMKNGKKVPNCVPKKEEVETTIGESTMTINFKDWQKTLQEGLKGNQHKLDKNKNGKLDSHDFKLLRKEDIESMTEEQIDEAINEVLSKDASAGDYIKDFVHSDNPKFAGKSKEKRKQMALAAYYAKQRNEEAECDDEDEKEDKKEMKEASCGKKTFREFVEEVQQIAELDINLIKSLQKDAKKKPMNKDPESERNAHKKYGYRSDDNEDDDDDEDAPKKKPAPTGEKRGRGRPKGSTSAARQKGSSSGKSYGGLPIHSLNLPNTNK